MAAERISGLLFIAPKQDEKRFWAHCGLQDPTIDWKFVELARTKLKPTRILSLLSDHPDHVKSVVDRLRLKFLHVTDLHHDITRITDGLNPSDRGQQTLFRLLTV